MRILVVDDEVAIRRLLRIGLGRQGYDVLDTATGRQGLEALALAPDLTILDLDLPDLDGFDVCVSCAKTARRFRSSCGRLATPRTTRSGPSRARPTTTSWHERAGGPHPRRAAKGGFKVDLVRRVVPMGDATVDLAAKEYQLLRFFVRHAGEAIP